MPKHQATEHLERLIRHLEEAAEVTKSVPANIRHNAGLWNTAVRGAKAFLEHWPEED